MKIPTIIGLALVVAVVGSIIFLVEYFSRAPAGAAGSIVPSNVIMTNVSDTSFTVTWFTDQPATGVVLAQAAKQKTLTYYDERDSAGKLGQYTQHSINVTSTISNTTYYLKILSNGKTFLDNGKPFSVTTGPTIGSNPSALEPAYGSVMTAAGQPAAGAIVYLTLEGGQLLSTLVSPTGTWLIPLNLTRTTTLAQYLSSKERITESIRVATSRAETTAITDTLNDSPVPSMDLGKTYDFRRVQAKAPSQPSVLGIQTQGSYQVALASPADGASLPTNLPLVSGTGVPGKTVAIVLGITNPIVGSTTVKPDGTWLFTPPKPLSEGKQSVTITSGDTSDNPIAITHLFTILKSGTQVLGEATPSATLAPTPTATPTAQPIPVSGSTVPTIILLVFGLGLLPSGGIVLLWKYD